MRVRLQSQSPPTPIDISKLAITTDKLLLPRTSQLGVTACCREVFFAGNTAEAYCLAGPAADCAVEDTQRRTYRSTLDGFRKIARNEGVTTLWRGLSPTLAMTIPANIIYFTGYDWLRHSQASPISRLSSDNAPLVGGSVARVLAAFAVSPIELVRTRMQAAPASTATNHLVQTFSGIREMVGIHGYTYLWRGLTLTLWRDVPFSGLYWWGYETIRGRLTSLRKEAKDNHSEAFLDSFTAGATSGALASILTMPFDVGKTRTQVAGRVQPEERNMAKLLWHIFKTEGMSGLWRGWIPRTLKVAPACAIMISSYEVGKRAFKGVNERKAEVLAAR